jgi:transcriptional regulator with AAA-type ATPase domain
MLKSDCPSNARELRNYVEQLVVTLGDITSIVEGRYIKHVLETFNGNATEAAKS